MYTILKTDEERQDGAVIVLSVCTKRCHKIISFGCYHTISTFSALTLLVGRQEEHPACKREWWGVGVVVCQEKGADLHMAQLMPLPLTVS